MARLGRSAALLAPLLALALSSGDVAAQKYGPDDPLPPDAKAVVLPLSGQVLDVQGTVLEIKATVLQIRGAAAGLAARVDPVQAALQELGARVQGKEIKIDLAADVLFDFDKTDLRREAGPALDKVVSVLRAYPKASATIDGHTDGKGTDQYNQRLSERRAESVRRWLAGAGVTTRLSSRGWGKARPVAPNARPDGSDDPEGRQKNRRVEITVKTQ